MSKKIFEHTKKLVFAKLNIIYQLCVFNCSCYAAVIAVMQLF